MAQDRLTFPEPLSISYDQKPYPERAECPLAREHVRSFPAEPNQIVKFYQQARMIYLIVIMMTTVFVNAILAENTGCKCTRLSPTLVQ